MLQRNIDHPHMGPGGQLQPRGGAVRLGHDAETEAISALVRAVKKNVRLIVATSVIGTAIAAGIAFTTTPQYRASAEILVDPRRTMLLKDREVVDGPGPGTDNSVIESEAELLQSPALMRRVAKHLKLDEDGEFGGPSLIGRVKSLLLWPVHSVFGGGSSNDQLAGVAMALANAVEAKRRNLTYVIELGVWSRDAAKAARLANTIADFYLADQIAAKRATAKEMTDALNRRIAEMRQRVTDSETAYEKYKAEFGLFDPGGENLPDRQIEKLSEQLVQARAEAAQAKAKYEQLRQVTPDKLKEAAASQDVLQSGVVSSLRGQYADAAKTLAEMTTRYGPQHPKVQIAQAQLKNIAAQITGEIGRIVASAKSDYEIAKSRQDSLKASLEDLQKHAGEFNEKAVRLHQLEGEAQANRDLFQALLSRAKETSAQLDMQFADSRVVSAAAVPTRASYPKRAQLIGIAFFGSLGLGIGLALARSALAKGVRDPEDVRSLVGLYPLASIPLVAHQVKRPALTNARLALADMRLLRKLAQPDENEQASVQPNTAPHLADMAFDRPDSCFAENIRTLCLTLKQLAKESDVRVVLITSALPGEGKSTVALNLARTAAATGDKVLLIDGDLRRPSLAKTLGITESWGLTDVLTGRGSLRGSLRRDLRSGLFIMAGDSGVSGSKALTLLSSGSMASLVSMARDAFDYVVIDASPVLPIADARRFADYVDGVVMVVASEETPREAVAAALRTAPSLADRLVGVVLNRCAEEGNGYYAYDERTVRASAQGAQS